jgi:nicotinamidase-related amidase
MVLERARELGLFIVYLRYSRRADHSFESPSTLRWMFVKRGYKENERSTIEGSWGWQIIDELKPLDTEAIVDKRRASGFHKKNRHLRRRVDARLCRGERARCRAARLLRGSARRLCRGI